MSRNCCSIGNAHNLQRVNLVKNRCVSFPPSVGAGARILILGSMPGGESLRKQQYYAFERNLFWRLVGEIFGFSPKLPYPERLAALREHRVALWDVLGACEREGSLDSSIREPVPNDIPGLLAAHPGIVRICCNGQAAAKYLKRFFPALPLEVVVLPSSSPAAAVYSYSQKLERWRAVLEKDLPSSEKRCRL